MHRHLKLNEFHNCWKVFIEWFGLKMSNLYIAWHLDHFEKDQFAQAFFYCFIFYRLLIFLDQQCPTCRIYVFFYDLYVFWLISCQITYSVVFKLKLSLFIYLDGFRAQVHWQQWMPPYTSPSESGLKSQASPQWSTLKRARRSTRFLNFGAKTRSSSGCRSELTVFSTQCFHGLLTISMRN